ncbi:MAG: HemK/PrmC family methyltransferase, partial [Pseudomonadota bacterium]
MTNAAGAPFIERLIREGARRLSMSASPMLDARLIVGRVLGLDAAELILRGRETPSADSVAAIGALIERRATGEPIAYLFGEKEFYGRVFNLAPGVLVPRPETEHLIEAVRAARDAAASLRILELGVGSGCVLTSLLLHYENAVGVGVDISYKAAMLTQRNLSIAGVGDRARVFVGDWADALDHDFDIVVSNPPYIEAKDMAT